MSDLIETIRKKPKKRRLLLFWISIVASVVFVFALWMFLPKNSDYTESVADEAGNGDAYNKEVDLPELKQAALDFFKEGKNLFTDTKDKVGESLDQTKQLIEKTEEMQSQQQPAVPGAEGAPETTDIPPTATATGNEAIPQGTDAQTTPNN
jgi:hypothetical protein